MKFLVDAQLRVRVARLLREGGHDALHTSQLPDENRSPDADIARIADAEDRVVISKDRDFRDSHLLRRSPQRLLVVATGNIANDELCRCSPSTWPPSSRRSGVRRWSSSEPTFWRSTATSDVLTFRGEATGRAEVVPHRDL